MEVIRFSQILLPVIGSQADEEAILFACRLGKQDKCQVRVIYVITLKRALPLDAEIKPEIQKAEEILNRIERIAAEHNYKIDTEVLQAREVGPAIVNEAVGSDVDLIVMGFAYKRRFGEFSLGEVVPYVLENAPCRVILYHLGPISNT